MRSIVALLVLVSPLAADTSGRRWAEPGPVRIAILYSRGVEPGSAPRLRAMKATVTIVTPDGLKQALKKTDLLFLTSEWACGAERQAVAQSRAEVEAFLRRGGAIYVSQPNIDAKITDLPLAFEVVNGYDTQDRGIAIDAKLFSGLEEVELPFPADRIVKYDAAFTVAAKGSSSGSPSVLLGHWKGGKILVNTDNDNVSDIKQFAVKTSHTSDRCLKKLIEWLAGHPLPK